MKKNFWKALGAATVVAATVPYCVKRNLENGDISVMALLYSINFRKGKNGDKKREIDVELLPLLDKLMGNESEDYDDELYSTDPFAEDEDEPVVTAPKDEAPEDAEEPAPAEAEPSKADDGPTATVKKAPVVPINPDADGNAPA